MRFVLCSVILSLSILAGGGIASADATAQFAAGGFRAPDEGDVNGFRFTLLFGQNDRMGGLDIGLLSLNESARLEGVAFVLGMHKLTQDMDGGAAFSLVNLHEGNDSGLNAAFINMVNGAEHGVDLGFVNIAKGRTMVDIAAFNLAPKSTAQVGIINVADEIVGFQIGFLNIAKNGFLPVFPFFNFPKR